MEWSTELITIIEGFGPVGGISAKGSFSFRSSENFEDSLYTLTGSGLGIGSEQDSFCFAWGKVDDDFEFFADIGLPDKSPSPPSEAFLMVRQSLEPDSPFACASVRADGLLRFQARVAKGQSAVELIAVKRDVEGVGLDLREDFVYMISEGEIAAGAVRLGLRPPYLVGLGISSHDRNRTETASFDRVYLEVAPTTFNIPFSILETIDVETCSRRTLAVAREYHHLEHPQWVEDVITVTDHDQVYSVPVVGGPLTITTMSVPRSSLASGSVSPDERWLAFFEYGPEIKGMPYDREMTLRLMDLKTKEVKVLAHLYGGKSSLDAPSWSPDGKQLAFVSYASV
jgi:hypothetical protein